MTRVNSSSVQWECVPMSSSYKTKRVIVSACLESGLWSATKALIRWSQWPTGRIQCCWTHVWTSRGASVRTSICGIANLSAPWCETWSCQHLWCACKLCRYKALQWPWHKQRRGDLLSQVNRAAVGWAGWNISMNDPLSLRWRNNELSDISQVVKTENSLLQPRSFCCCCW